MAQPGTELIVSLRRDPQFGPTLNLGLGGVHAEIYRDVATRLLPVDDDSLAAMAAELRGGQILTGFRGQPTADVAAIMDVLKALQKVAQDDPTIALVEINPLVAWPAGRGVASLDVLIQHEATA
jgi:hypothetical protein